MKQSSWVPILNGSQETICFVNAMLTDSGSSHMSKQSLAWPINNTNIFPVLLITVMSLTSLGGICIVPCESLFLVSSLGPWHTLFLGGGVVWFSYNCNTFFLYHLVPPSQFSSPGALPSDLQAILVSCVSHIILTFSGAWLILIQLCYYKGV